MEGEQNQMTRSDYLDSLVTHLHFRQATAERRADKLLAMATSENPAVSYWSDYMHLCHRKIDAAVAAEISDQQPNETNHPIPPDRPDGGADLLPVT